MSQFSSPAPMPGPVNTPQEQEFMRIMLMRARQTSFAVRFLAWITAILIVISIIMGAVIASQIANAASASQQCQSQGGTIQGC